jgi:hypothetical protein
MNILKKSLTSVLFVVFAIFVPLTLAPLPVGAQSCELDSDSFLGIPAWYKYLETSNDESGRCSPQLTEDSEGNKINSVLPIGLAVLEAMIRLAGLVAVIMIFFAGFKFITSQGNPDAAAAARKTAINALIGLVIVVLSTTIISFIGNSLL